ncbi:TetR/AcrR family transcriptional regulator [Actinacidiphila oryziradicis]|uniref:TetR/AcrR family transcriptional regulator n=1 Tax=Actinacidiphila oryziradicis TaxID=2571141 RepID=A0A4U0S0R3_9ACTN|nr:TetR/AcrR family transcriptional regulator [Actinacidiphila oryziradicis]TKA01653.1 TetR/AcrR family transcriptional regulator [Actinacidiphila oryziradicis]
MANTRSATKPSARERLLAAANELFYAEGVQTVGIDRIIEHAGVAKASLYNTFGGKEQLIRAYLDSHHTSTSEGIERAIARHDTPRERLLSVFEAQGEVFAQPDFHGCAFVSAAAEARPGSLVDQAADEYRAWIRAKFTGLAKDAGAANPEALARQLQLLYDGAGLSARMDHDPSAAIAARAAASALLDAAVTGTVEDGLEPAAPASA